MDGTTNPAANPAEDTGIRLRLRQAHLATLHEMYWAQGGHQSLSEFCSEMIESCVADFRLARIPPAPDEPRRRTRRAEPDGTLPRFHRVRRVSDEQIQEMRALRDDEGMKPPAIAARFHLSAVTVRRLLRGTKKEK